MEPNLKLSRDDDDLIDDPTMYRRLVGCLIHSRRLVGRLIYLIRTRPDLAYFVHILANSWTNLVNHTWIQYIGF
jgi:hypothetical protein